MTKARKGAYCGGPGQESTPLIGVSDSRADPFVPAFEASTVTALVGDNREAVLTADVTLGQERELVSMYTLVVGHVPVKTRLLRNQDVFVSRSEGAEQGFRVSPTNDQQRPRHVLRATFTNALQRRHSLILR